MAPSTMATQKVFFTGVRFSTMERLSMEIITVRMSEMAALVAERRDWRHLYCVMFAMTPANETVSAIHACRSTPSQVKDE